MISQVFKEIILHLPDCKKEIIKTEYILYLLIVLLAVLSAAILLCLLRKSTSRLPQKWAALPDTKTFKRGIVLLLIYLSIVFVGELIAILLGTKGIYNSYIISLNTSLYTPFLYGFLFLYTHTTWKRYSYVILYFVLLGYFISGGYYHPRSVLGGTAILVIYIPFFLAALIHLTDLLLEPQNTWFKFRLRLTLIMLFSSVISLIIQSFEWYYEEEYNSRPMIVFYISLSNIVLYYSSLTLIFLLESVKLYRKQRLIQTR